MLLLALTSCGGGGGSDANQDASKPEHTYYADADGDGFGDRDNPVKSSDTTAPAGAVDDYTDCDDDDDEVSPEATEECNGRDDNCDDVIDRFGASPCLGLASIKGSSSFGCGVVSDGRLMCWGYDGPPAFMPGVQDPKDYSLAGDTVCVLQEDAVACWQPGWGGSPYTVHTDSTAQSFSPATASQIMVHGTGNEENTSTGATIDVSVVDDGRLVRLSRYTGDEEVEILPFEAEVLKLSWDELRTCLLNADHEVYCAYQLVGHRDWHGTTPSTADALLEPRYYVSEDELYELELLGAGGPFVGNVIPGMGSAVQVAITGGEACGRSADGKVACWEGEAPVTQAKEIAGVAGDICWIDDSDSLQCGTDDGPVHVPPPLPSDVGEGWIAGLGSTEGACDNVRDAATLRGARTTLTPECVSDCASTLDPEPCEFECVQPNHPLSDACAACVVADLKCMAREGESSEECLSSFAECAGFSL